MKTVSVIIPVYKVEPYLKMCVESVLKQTYPYLDIVLVDDGSPDKCPEICDEFAKKDSRIQVIHKQNGGLSSARNAGIDVAFGEYICFIDSDDYIETDMVEKLLEGIEKNNGDVCICGYSVDIYNESGDEVSNRDLIPPCSNIDKQLSLREYEYILGICGYAWNKLYRREFLQKYNLRFQEKISLVEDLLFNSTVFCAGAKVCFIHYSGYHYIQRQRETLGVKYYENFFELKGKAIEAKRNILINWGVSKQRISQFLDNNYVDIVWGTIKNICNSDLSYNEKVAKVKGFIKSNGVKKKIKSTKVQDRKRKIKRLLIKYLNIKILLRVVK